MSRLRKSRDTGVARLSPLVELVMRQRDAYDGLRCVGYPGQLPISPIAALTPALRLPRVTDPQTDKTHYATKGDPRGPRFEDLRWLQLGQLPYAKEPKMFFMPWGINELSTSLSGATPRW